MKGNEVIGILGGMGPAATADFYNKLVANTHVPTDQDHPRVVIWADPSIPDRTEALLDGGEDPAPWMLRGIDVLAGAGATMVAIPCNTAHAFLPGLLDRSPIPIVHMIGEVARSLARVPGVTRVGLLATSGTCGTGIYSEWLGREGIDVLVPDSATQGDAVMRAIRAIKAGDRSARVTELLHGAASTLVQRGAQRIIAGCTEIPLALTSESLSVPLIDPGHVLALAVLERAGYGAAQNRDVEPAAVRRSARHKDAVCNVL